MSSTVWRHLDQIRDKPEESTMTFFKPPRPQHLLTLMFFVSHFFPVHAAAVGFLRANPAEEVVTDDPTPPSARLNDVPVPTSTIQRSLQNIKIEVIGNNGSPSDSFPLGRCQGDCDGDNECSAGLVCFQRDGEEVVPGCIGGEDQDGVHDYCIINGIRTPAPAIGPAPPTPNPTLDPTLPPVRFTTAPVIVRPNSLQRVCNDDDCTSPLQLCQGDCDRDSDCLGSAVCWQRSSNQVVPGCLGGEDYDDSTDFCIEANNVPTFAPVRPNSLQRVCNDNDCTSPLQLCQGDCDRDSDCLGTAVCWQRSSNQLVPGCLGGEDYDDSTDFCIKANNVPTFAPVSITGQTFRLKLYYERGYCWQGDCEDPDLCAFYNYDRSYCYYNNRDSDDCEDDRLYIDECGDDHGDDKFRFIDLGGGRVAIQATQEDGKCLQRRGTTRIHVEDCDTDDESQRWYSPRGSFGGKKFEISIDGDRCMTQAHHPKSREVIELKDCEEERDADTTYWERD